MRQTTGTRKSPEREAGQRYQARDAQSRCCLQSCFRGFIEFIKIRERKFINFLWQTIH